MPKYLVPRAKQRMSITQLRYAVPLPDYDDDKSLNDSDCGCRLVWTALQEAAQDTEKHQDVLLEALQLLVEIVVWGDQNEPLVSRSSATILAAELILHATCRRLTFSWRTTFLLSCETCYARRHRCACIALVTKGVGT